MPVRVVHTEPLQFAHGLAVLEHPDIPPGPPSVHVDLIRPDDLVALSVDAVNCELVSGGARPAHLRPIAGAQARLVVRLAFQHLGEQAVYEGFLKRIPRHADLGYDGKPFEPDPVLPGEGPAARPPVPAGARPARASRLVYGVSDDEIIEFSTVGLLAAMGRLPLVVHPLAQPGEAPGTGRTSHRGPVIVLPGGLIGQIVADGLELSSPSRVTLGELDLPREGTLDAASFEARQLRRARALLQARAATVAPHTALPDATGHRPTLRIGGSEVGAAALFGPGGLAAPPAVIHRPLRPRPILSRPPAPDETAIEAPYRLVISPSAEARWAHAIEPVSAEGHDRHIELWHSRLAAAGTASDGSTVADERNARRRIVRAVWARDRDTAGDWRDPKNNLGHEPPFGDPPYRMSLDRADRHMLVRQSAETWTGRAGPIAPVPIGANALWLSALGAWLDLHGGWTTKPYSAAEMSSILAWDHIATLGRDQYVQVTYPGYLYPWGHRTALVKVTERKMKDAAPSVAGLYQRKLLVVSEPLRVYPDRHDLPFTQVAIRPLVTPTLDEPGNVEGDSQDSFFWPSLGGVRFGFTIDARDHDNNPVRPPRMPLIWVAEHYTGFGKLDAAYDGDPDRVVRVRGQRIVFAPARPGDDTSAETATISLRGAAMLGDSVPRMSRAEVLLPAVQQLSSTTPLPIAYHPAYKQAGFANPGQLWARVLVQGEQTPEHPSDLPAPLPQLRFGAGALSGTDKAGGFLSPNLPIRALSRLTGIVGDAGGSVNPKDYLKGSSAKLFGLVSLEDLVDLVDSDVTKIPAVVSEVVDRIEGFIADLARAKATVQQAVEEAQKMIARAAGKPAELQQQAADARARAEELRTRITTLVDDLPAKLTSLKNKSEADVAALLSEPLAKLRAAVADFRQLGATLPPFIRNLIDALATLLDEVLGAGDLIQDLYRFINGFASSFALVRFRYEWRPVMVTAWPSSAVRILEMKRDSFLLAIHGQAGGNATPGVQVLAELRDFTLHLLPKAPLVRLAFEHLSFKAGTSGKPDVDLVLADIEFCGVLSFVEDLKDAIPLDGFSDPPYLDVTPEGMVAGFSIALPDLALGIFAITNLSLGADVQVPFLGKVVTVGFNFCTRERPFTIAVAFLGGGGWCGVRISPDGLDVLEVGLEAGACVAVDFGVASGSVSAMLGIYIRLEADEGSIAGYFRLRGQVDVLGLVSASLELYMELKYETATGKLTGRASITLSVSVMGISKSVQITAQRTFAGSNGDPSFREVMGAESGISPAWTSYCLAFSGE